MDAAEINPKRLIWARNQLVRRDQSASLARFGAAVVRDKAGLPLKFPLLHLAWIAHTEYCWERERHAGIFGRGGAGFLVTMAAWLLGRDQAARVALACNSDRHAALRGRAVRSLVSTPAYQRVFPAGAGELRWTDAMALPAGDDAVEPRLEVRGIGSRAVGASFTHLLFDNVTDPASVSTFQRRKEGRRQVEAAWLPLLEPGGRALWVSRPWDPDDASFALRARQDFCWLEQRQKPDGTWEQDVHGAGPEYAEVVRAKLVGMLAG